MDRLILALLVMMTVGSGGCILETGGAGDRPDQSQAPSVTLAVASPLQEAPALTPGDEGQLRVAPVLALGRDSRKDPFSHHLVIEFVGQQAAAMGARTVSVDVIEPTFNKVIEHVEPDAEYVARQQPGRVVIDLPRSFDALSTVFRVSVGFGSGHTVTQDLPVDKAWLATLPEDAKPEVPASTAPALADEKSDNEELP